MYNTLSSFYTVCVILTVKNEILLNASEFNVSQDAIKSAVLNKITPAHKLWSNSTTNLFISKHLILMSLENNLNLLAFRPTALYRHTMHNKYLVVSHIHWFESFGFLNKTLILTKLIINTWSAVQLIRGKR